jgi:protein O-GlcNAc transferase
MDDNVNKLFNDAVTKHVSGDLASAERTYQRILALNPNHVGALANLGRIARTNKDIDTALELYAKAASQKNAPADIFYNLGNVYSDLGKIENACASYQRALELKPNFPQAASRLAALQQQPNERSTAPPLISDSLTMLVQEAAQFEKTGQHEKAEQQYRAILGKATGHREASTRLAQILFRRGNGDEAVAILERLLKGQPDDHETMQNLGFIFRSTGHYEKALKMFEKAHTLAPEVDILRVEKANCLINLGRAHEGRKIFNQLLQTPQGRRCASSSYLMALLYDPETSPEMLLREHKRLTKDWTTSPKTLCLVKTTKSKEIRVGYLTSDFFGHHPVAQFITPVLEAHSKKSSSINSVAYDASPRHDKTAKSMHALCEVRDISALDDFAASELIKKDNLDILIDLSGHTSGRRLSILGHRPAPAQACFIGYPSTTGFGSVDYLIADRHLIPADQEHHYSEKILHLPASFLCFQPPVDMPKPSNTKKTNKITFGSLNHLPKLNDEVIATWAEILNRAPDSDLLLQCGAFSEDSVRSIITKKFAQHGIEAVRLILYGPQNFTQAMGRYDEIDIALDPFPYNGGTTTCHALWMGTPVITLTGQYFCGRMGDSILSAADRAECIAKTVDQYVEIAVSTASDHKALRKSQRSLISDIKSSALCNVDNYAQELANLYISIAR